MNNAKKVSRPGSGAAGLAAVVLGALVVWHLGSGRESSAQGSPGEPPNGVEDGLARARPAYAPAADSPPQVAATGVPTLEPVELETADRLRSAATVFLAAAPAGRPQLELELQQALARLEEIGAERNRLADRITDLLTERDALRESDPDRAAELLSEAEEARADLISLCMQGTEFADLLFECGAEPALRGVIADFRDGNELRPELQDGVEKFLRGEISKHDLTALINPAYVRFQASADAFNEVGDCTLYLGDALLGMWGTEHLSSANPEAAEVYLAEALPYFEGATLPAELYHLALLNLAKKGQVAAVEKALKFQERYGATRSATPMPTFDYNEACFWFVTMQNRLASPSVGTVENGIALLHRALDGASDEHRLELAHGILEDPDLAGLRELIEQGHDSALALKARIDAIRNAGKE